jgi:hypothetical protein
MNERSPVTHRFPSRTALGAVGGGVLLLGSALVVLASPGTPAREALDRAGVTVAQPARDDVNGAPDAAPQAAHEGQGAGQAVREAVHQAIDDTEPGPERGRAVSAAACGVATAGAAGKGPDACDRGHVGGPALTQGNPNVGAPPVQAPPANPGQPLSPGNPVGAPPVAPGQGGPPVTPPGRSP